MSAVVWLTLLLLVGAACGNVIMVCCFPRVWRKVSSTHQRIFAHSLVQTVPGTSPVAFPSLEAAFGTSLMKSGLQGLLVRLTGADATACSPLQVSPPTSESMIALVSRGGMAGRDTPCDFDLKVPAGHGVCFSAL